MKKHFLLAAMISTGLAFAPAALAQSDKMGKPDAMTSPPAKPMMDKKDNMAKPGDKMQPAGGMMDKKDGMSGGMKK